MSQQEITGIKMGTLKLSKEEIEDPYIVIQNLFDFAHLPNLRQMLWEWLKISVTNGYTKDMYGFRQRDSIVLIYEKMEALIEAVWLINEREFEPDDENTDDENEGDSGDAGE